MRDVEWKKDGLGQRSRELVRDLEACGGNATGKEKEVKVYARVFGEMLERGVTVPIVAGGVR